MKLKIGKNEYSIKFGYKPTLKERIISKVINASSALESGGDMEKLEDLLLFLPELLLVGLQVNHKEFRYDYDTKEGKEEQLDKAFALVEEYMDGEDADIMAFFGQFQKALLQDSFLRSLFQEERKKREAIEEATETAATEVSVEAKEN